MAVAVVQARYNEIEAISSQFGQASERCADLERRLRQSCGPLQDGGWQGRGAEAFSGEMDSVLFPAIQRLIAALDTAREVTCQIGTLLQGAEQEAAAIFQNGGSGGSSALASAGIGGILLGGAVTALAGVASPAATAIGNFMKGVALNMLRPGRYVFKAWTTNFARGKTSVAAIVDMTKGKGKGLWLLRFDNAHNNTLFPHINLNFDLTRIEDPHMRIPPAILEAAGKGARLLEAAQKIAIPVAIAIDTFRLGSAFHDDGNQIGSNTKRTAGSVAGGWAGAWAGAEAGAWIGGGIGFAVGSVVPVLGNAAGAGIGGVIGGIVGGIGGAFGGSWLGEQAGSKL